MDLRIEKTKTALRNAYLKLRSEKNTDKITVRELCTLARVNKSTFYTHYRDIYDLAETVEVAVIQEILANIPSAVDYSTENPEVFAKVILDTCIDHLATAMQLFSEEDIHRIGQRLDSGIRELIYAKYPHYRTDPRMDILLTFCIMGAHYAYWEHRDIDREALTRLISELIRQIQPMM